MRGHLKQSCILWNCNVNITLIQKPKCSSHCQNQYCSIQLQPGCAWSSRAPTCAQQSPGSTGWSLLLLLLLGCSQCAPLLQAAAAGPRGASAGWELRWHLAEAQRGKMLLWACIYHKQKYGLAFVVRRGGRRDMYANISRVIALSFLLSTRCSQR